MTVKELIGALSEFDPNLQVVGYCERSEDDFIVQEAIEDHTITDGTTEARLASFYNQGVSCMAEEPAQTVVVLC